MPNIDVITDYATNEVWTIDTQNDTIIKNIALGKLASLGSVQGFKLQEQVQVLESMLDAVDTLKSKIADFVPENFGQFTFDADGKLALKPPQDISDIWSTSLFFQGLPVINAPTDVVDRFINFYEKFKDLNPSNPPVVANTSRTTYQDPFSGNPVSVLTELVVTVPADGSAGFFQPFRREGLEAYTFMMVPTGTGSAQVVVSSMENFMRRVEGGPEYSAVIESVANARSAQLQTQFSTDALPNVPLDTVQWRVTAPGARNGLTGYSGPVQSLSSTLTLVTTQPIGTLIKTELGVTYRVTQPSVFGLPAGLEVVELVPPPNRFIAPSDDTLRSIRSQYADKIVIATQRSSQQQLFINSILQKFNYHFDAATNVLKAFNDLSNRMAGNI
jgi:hypothetical protein